MSVSQERLDWLLAEIVAEVARSREESAEAVGDSETLLTDLEKRLLLGLGSMMAASEGSGRVREAQLNALTDILSPYMNSADVAPVFEIPATSLTQQEAEHVEAIRSTLAELPNLPLISKSDYCLPSDVLPHEFSYPLSFQLLVERGLLNWEPWECLAGRPLLDRFIGVRGRYPDRQLIPFARRADRDDVACWDLDRSSGTISVIEDFAPPGDEQTDLLGSLADWLRLVLNDMIEFEEQVGDDAW